MALHLVKQDIKFVPAARELGAEGVNTHQTSLVRFLHILSLAYSLASPPSVCFSCSLSVCMCVCVCVCVSEVQLVISCHHSEPAL